MDRRAAICIFKVRWNAFEFALVLDRRFAFLWVCDSAQSAVSAPHSEADQSLDACRASGLLALHRDLFDFAFHVSQLGRMFDDLVARNGICRICDFVRLLRFLGCVVLQPLHHRHALSDGADAMVVLVDSAEAA